MWLLKMEHKIGEVSLLATLHIVIVFLSCLSTWPKATKAFFLKTNKSASQENPKGTMAGIYTFMTQKFSCEPKRIF